MKVCVRISQRWSTVLLILLSRYITGCESEIQYSSVSEFPLGSAIDSPAMEADKFIVASNIVLHAQQDNIVLHRITADTISVRPRDFAAFQVNGLNELVLEAPKIEILGTEPTNEVQNGSGMVRDDVTKTMRDFVERLPRSYGHVTRLNMQNVQIILKGRSAEGHDITVIADRLLKDFNDNSDPELFSVSFYDYNAGAEMSVSRVSWDTEAGTFEILNSLEQ